MKLLVFGSSGQLATALRAINPSASFVGRAECDLTQSSADVIQGLIQRASPDAVINAAAYTAVDKAETDHEAAFALNAVAPGAMAIACATRNIPLVHVSTDYVFDGAPGRAWEPDDPTEPLNTYGRSKLAGERAVRAAGGRFVILRTSWVFSATGSNFLKTMLRIGAERAQVSVVSDQIGGPTPATSLAAALLVIAQELSNNAAVSGAYHFSGSPCVSWADFARAIFAAAEQGTQVRDIATEDYPTAARRPLNSCLDCAATANTFGLSQPDWRTAAGDVVRDLRGLYA